MTQLSNSERVTRFRRWLVIHRRAVSALLAFAAALFALQALTADPESESGGAGPTTARSIADGLLEVPVRMSDPGVSDLLSAGDVVDVMGSDARGPTEVVAQELLVVSIPDPDDGSAFSSGGDGLVVVAATPEDALALADAASRGPLTVAVHP